MNTTNWQSLAEKGIASLRQNQVREGLNQLIKAAKLAPRERVLRYWLANGYRMNGDLDRSERIFRKLLEEKAGDFDSSFGLAFLLRDAGKPAEAAVVLQAAAEQPGLTLNHLLQITGFLRDSNQFAAAIPVCSKALELSPRRADLFFKLARLYQATGDFDRSLEHLKTALDLKPSVGPAWTVLAQQKRFESADDPEFKRIQRASGSPHGNEADMCIAFAYGKALDDLKRWPEAWAQYERGNELISLTRLWNRDAWNRLVERVTSGATEARAPVGERGKGAVFVVGLPRSGTTLLEQLLDRQGNISGRGELNFLDHFAKQKTALGMLSEQQKQEMAASFMSQLRLGGPEDEWYVDKNPLNFRYLDTLFELLPAARVLHITRDARDTCLSCYFQPFEHNDAAFSNSLPHLIEFYSGYKRLMKKWAGIYGERILTVKYDELVNRTDQVMAEVLQFIGTGDSLSPGGLANQDGLVRSASAWQARQPVHNRSIARWRHYYDQAPQFFDQLAVIDAE
jgi:tetratricopeptide (TPR) repeat protein